MDLLQAVQTPQTAINKEFYFVIAALVLAMISCGFLADALRRLKNSFQVNHKFSENKRTMFLHVAAIIGSQLALFALILIMDKAISNRGGYKLKYNLLRILFTITFAGSQAVFVYLLIQFQRPI